MISLLTIFAYLLIGGLVCYFIKANAGDSFVNHYDDDCSSFVAILTGVFWPIVSPFTIAILFAKKKR